MIKNVEAHVHCLLMAIVTHCLLEDPAKQAEQERLRQAVLLTPGRIFGGARLFC